MQGRRTRRRHHAPRTSNEVVTRGRVGGAIGEAGLAPRTARRARNQRLIHALPAHTLRIGVRRRRNFRDEVLLQYVVGLF